MKSAEYFRANNPDTEGRNLRLEDDSSLQDRIDSFEWYHTIELPHRVVTNGVYDHRGLVPHYGIADNLQGKSVMDVATFDGFWAFEFEKRGAQVTAVDLPRLSQVDFPPRVRQTLIDLDLDQELGRGFELASQALGSKVQRKWMNIYDLSPENVGRFDVVHIADVLLHLERPLDALRAIRSVTKEEALIVDVFNPSLQDFSGRKLTQYLGGWWTVTWWLPSLDTLAQMVLDSGFSKVEVHKVYTLAKRGETEAFWRAVIKAKP